MELKFLKYVYLNFIIDYFVYFIIILMPIVTFIVPHGTSSANIILSAIGISSLFFVQQKYKINNSQKLLISAFLFYYIITLFSFLINDWNYLGWKKIGRHAKLLLFIPMTFLFLKIYLKQSSFWYGVIIGAIGAGLYGLLQGFATGWPDNFRAEGAIFPIHYGNFSLVLAFMSLGAISYFKKQYDSLLINILPWLGFLFGLIACILSATKGSWLAFPALSVIFFWYTIKNHSIFYSYLMTILIIIFISAYFFIFNFNLQNRIKDMSIEINEYLKYDVVSEKKSVLLRLEMWKGSLRIIRDNYIIGVGVGNYKHEINKMIKKNELSKSISGFDHPHNTYLLVLASKGILGFITFLFFLLTSFLFLWNIMNKYQNISALGFSGLILVVAYMHFGLTESIFDRSPSINFFVFFLSLIFGLINQQKKVKYNLLK